MSMLWGHTIVGEDGEPGVDCYAMLSLQSKFARKFTGGCEVGRHGTYQWSNGSRGERNCARIGNLLTQPKV